MQRVVVIGTGSWGLALAQHLAALDNDVAVVGRRHKVVDEINRNRTSVNLPQAKFNENVTAYTFDNISDLIGDRRVENLVLAVPSYALEYGCNIVNNLSPNKVVHVIKGFEPTTLMQPSEYIHKKTKIDSNNIAYLTGPTFADEVALGQPTACVIAGEKSTTTYFQKMFTDTQFRCYTSDDIVGSQLGGALKNILAIAYGMCIGLESSELNLGENAKAAVISRGIAEVARLGKAYGANPYTFMGLSGIGDLLLTCASSKSRNRQAGELYGRGLTTKEIIEKLDLVPEGITTAKSIAKISKAKKVEMPICEAVKQIVEGKIQPKQAVGLLLSRPVGNE
jgi:glycerol-3-phosphate dehydrogenase (NAD(P)+)